MKKKLLLVLISIILLAGCNGKKSDENSNIPEVPDTPKIVYSTEEDVQKRLMEIADDIYENKTYKDYPKEEGKYFISLEELRNKLNYKIPEIDNLENIVCDVNETGIFIDEDNLSKESYSKYPTIVTMLCNPKNNNSNED